MDGERAPLRGGRVEAAVFGRHVQVARRHRLRAQSVEQRDTRAGRDAHCTRNNREKQVTSCSRTHVTKPPSKLSMHRCAHRCTALERGSNTSLHMHKPRSRGAERWRPHTQLTLHVCLISGCASRISRVASRVGCGEVNARFICSHLLPPSRQHSSLDEMSAADAPTCSRAAGEGLQVLELPPRGNVRERRAVRQNSESERWLLFCAKLSRGNEGTERKGTERVIKARAAGARERQQAVTHHRGVRVRLSCALRPECQLISDQQYSQSESAQCSEQQCSAREQKGGIVFIMHIHIHRAMGNGNAAHRERVDGTLNSRAAQEVIRGAAANGDGFD